MISTEKIDYSFDIMQPCRFASDKEGHTLEVLRNELQGTCYQGSYIVDIKGVDAISLIRTINTDNKAPSSVSVSFTAVVVRYPRRSIIPVAIVSIAEPCAYAKSAAALVALTYPVEGTKKLISDGMKVPILITGDCSYPTGSPHITVEGCILSCRREVEVFKASGSLTESEHKKLLPLLQHAISLEPAGDTKTLAAAAMLHSRKDMALKSKVLSLDTLVNAVGESFNGYWYRNLDLRTESLFVCRSDTNPGSRNPLELSPFQVLSCFLHGVISHRIVIRALASEYTEEELERIRPVLEAHRPAA